MAAWETSASKNKAHTFAQPIKRPMESNFSSPIIGANMGIKNSCSIHKFSRSNSWKPKKGEVSIFEINLMEKTERLRSK